MECFVTLVMVWRFYIINGEKKKLSMNTLTRISERIWTLLWHICWKRRRKKKSLLIVAWISMECFGTVVVIRVWRTICTMRREAPVWKPSWSSPWVWRTVEVGSWRLLNREWSQNAAVGNPREASCPASAHNHGYDLWTGTTSISVSPAHYNGHNS